MTIIMMTIYCCVFFFFDAFFVAVVFVVIFEFGDRLYFSEHQKLHRMKQSQYFFFVLDSRHSRLSKRIQGTTTKRHVFLVFSHGSIG